jgi:tetraacyldisaccharide-1-P 4'-kinase
MFPDHHVYTSNDVEKLTIKARKRGAVILLTTAKDAVKLMDLKIDLPCFVVESEMVFAQESEFRKWLLKMRNEK